MSFEALRSPGLLLKVIFWLYSVILLGLGISVYSIFTRREILLSHLRELFDTLTRFRIWTIQNRRIYTVLISGVLILFALAVVYVAERAHYVVYETEPLFASLPEFFYWIVVAMVSGLEKGQAPQSFVGLLITGIMPLFLLGTIVTIVRFTSEQGHELLMTKMGRGEIPTYRVIVFNYQSKFDDTIYRLLEHTDSFVVVLAADEHLQDAEGLKQNFDETSDEAYRLLVDELSYSNDVLFDQYDLLGADEIYMLSDMSEDADYRNLLLLTEINERVKQWDNMEAAVNNCPQILWEAKKSKFKSLSQELDSETFQRNFYPVSFYEDATREVFSNLRDPIEGINRYFGLASADRQLDWITGYGLENYTFTSERISAAERGKLEEIRNTREEIDRDDRKEQNVSELSTLKAELLDDIEQRLREEESSGDGIKPFYGVLVDIAGNEIPMDPSTAFLSQQIETTQETLQIRKGDSPSRDADGMEDGITGDLYLMNLNNKSKHFLHVLDEETRGLSTVDADVTVFHTEHQIKPELEMDVDFVTYEKVSTVARYLFHDAVDGTGGPAMDTGDTLLLFLDHESEDPHIKILRTLDNIDEQLHEEDTEGLSHNDIFLGVESTEGGYHRIYEYLSVDKTIDTFVTRRSFLHNLIELRNDDVLKELEREGTLTAREAFEWALRSAYNLRHYVVEDAADLDWNDTQGDALINENHLKANSRLRRYEQPSRQLFTSFRVARGGDERPEPTIEMIELTEDKEIAEDEYLMFLPYI